MLSPESNRLRATSQVAGDVPVYHMHIVEIAAALGVNVKHGISESEVEERRRNYGTNQMTTIKKTNYFLLFLGHMFNSITFILYAVFILNVVNEEYIDAGIVMGLILGNAILGFVQEFKSEKSLEALHKMSVGTATVLRDDTTKTININDVVVGDIVLLKSGDQIPADIRFMNCINLEIDEALLTGESVPVFKCTEPLPLPKQNQETLGLDVRVAVGDRNNMGFRQTTVCGGTGTGIVTAVGYNTKVGQLSSRLQNASDEKTPLQKRMNMLMYILFGVALVLALVIFAITGFKFDKETSVYASATGIALLPESLVAVVTVTLALAVNRMAQKKAIIKKLSAVEILGSVTDICSDKTGTLTEGKMVVKRMWPANSPYIYHVTGGAMDATGGFGVEVDPIPSSPLNETRTLIDNSKENHDNDELAPSSVRFNIDDNNNNQEVSNTTNNRASRATSRATSRADRTNSRFRAPSYAHNVMKVVQGSKESEYKNVQAAAEDLALVCAMCNNTQLQLDEEDDKLIGSGNPTELALQVLSFKLGRSPYYYEDQGWIKCGQWAFDSSVKCMSVGVIREIDSINENDDQIEYESLILTKGAPEAILPKCVDIKTDNIMAKVTHLAQQGFRVLACAKGKHLQLRDEDGKRLHDFERHLVEQNLEFVGLVVVFDPPRPEALDTIKKCLEAGITVRMVTGDHHATAESIARRLHILEDYHGKNRVITGPILDAMSEEQIDAMDELPLVIARCSPESKVKMVEALHRRNQIVAMTGDGINDAPAIKIADVGACMGISGVDVTKGAADIVLADDNLATLVSAVEEGRNVAVSIRKFIVHLLTSNIAEVCILMVGLAFRDKDDNVVFPMTALEILWLNMLTSTPPAIGLSIDPMDPEAMKRGPDRKGLFSNEVMTDQAVYGLLMGAIAFSSYILVIFGFGDGNLGRHCSDKNLGNDTCRLVWEARTTVFVSLNEMLLFHGYVCRSPRRSMFSLPLFNNYVLVGSVILGTILLMPVIYIPAVAKKLFKHAPIDYEWFIIIGAVIVFILFTEIYKAIKRACWPDDETTQSAKTVVTEDGGQLELVPM